MKSPHELQKLAGNDDKELEARTAPHEHALFQDRGVSYQNGCDGCVNEVIYFRYKGA